MKSIREWLDEKGVKLELHSVQDAMGGVRGDRKELGSQGFEGLQDVIDALKVAARSHSSSVGSMLNRLSMLVRQEDEELANRVKITGQKFLGAERSLANKEEAPAADDPIAREAP
jgi:hypothetical protein